jgi:transcription elongation factor Elf1
VPRCALAAFFNCLSVFFCRLKASQGVTFDEQATIGNRVCSIKQQGHSWVVIRAINDIDDRYHVFDSIGAAKRQAEEWEQAI